MVETLYDLNVFMSERATNEEPQELELVHQVLSYLYVLFEFLNLLLLSYNIVYIFQYDVQRVAVAQFLYFTRVSFDFLQHILWPK